METSLAQYSPAILQGGKGNREKNKSQSLAFAGHLFQWRYINKYAFVFKLELWAAPVIENIPFCLLETVFQ